MDLSLGEHVSLVDLPYPNLRGPVTLAVLSVGQPGPFALLYQSFVQELQPNMVHVKNDSI